MIAGADSTVYTLLLRKRKECANTRDMMSNNTTTFSNIYKSPSYYLCCKCTKKPADYYSFVIPSMVISSSTLVESGLRSNIRC
ncbi:MAG TPA: hypothetical protein VHG34_02590 [Nitrososphaeraceae archaeon]|nr:hypothetical protein [Nitrososphaeraceae archaeon]